MCSLHPYHLDCDVHVDLTAREESIRAIEFGSEELFNIRSAVVYHPHRTRIHDAPGSSFLSRPFPPPVRAILPTMHDDPYNILIRITPFVCSPYRPR
jgi:hypothetical protein